MMWDLKGCRTEKFSAHFKFNFFIFLYQNNISTLRKSLKPTLVEGLTKKCPMDADTNSDQNKDRNTARHNFYVAPNHGNDEPALGGKGDWTMQTGNTGIVNRPFPLSSPPSGVICNKTVVVFVAQSAGVWPVHV